MAVIHSDPSLRNLSSAEALHDLLASRLHKYLTRKHNSIHVKMMLWWLSRRMEFRVSQRSESVLLSRHLGEHDVRTLPAASGAQIYHGVAFLVPHFLPQATKCACFYLLHELALWLAAGTLPFGTHLLTEDWGVWTTWSLRSPLSPILNTMTKLCVYVSHHSCFCVIQEHIRAWCCSQRPPDSGLISHRSRKTELATLLTYLWWQIRSKQRGANQIDGHSDHNTADSTQSWLLQLSLL